jgi:hypothetical protein
MLELLDAPSATPIPFDDASILGSTRPKRRDFREIAVVDANLEQVTADFIDGQYVEPLKIVSFNIRGGWSRDTSAEVGWEIERRALRSTESFPKGYANLLQSISKRSVARVTLGYWISHVRLKTAPHLGPKARKAYPGIYE